MSGSLVEMPLAFESAARELRNSPLGELVCHEVPAPAILARIPLRFPLGVARRFLDLVSARWDDAIERLRAQVEDD